MAVNEKVQEILKSEELLFKYLKNIMYKPEQASLDVDCLEEHMRRLGKGLQFMAECLKETKQLSAKIRAGNEARELSLLCIS